MRALILLGAMTLVIVALVRALARYMDRRIAREWAASQRERALAGLPLLDDDADAPDETHVEWFNYLDRDMPRRNGRAS